MEEMEDSESFTIFILFITSYSLCCGEFTESYFGLAMLTVE